MSPFGIVSFKDNKAIITPDGAAGVFVAVVTFGTAYARYTFNDLDGMQIVPVLISGGYHAWTQGIDGSGFPYIEAQGYPIPSWPGSPAWPAGAFDTKIGVFAK